MAAQRVKHLCSHLQPLPIAAVPHKYPALSFTEKEAQQKVIYQKKGHVAYIIINRPQRLNACDYETYGRLEEIWYDYIHDNDMRVAIFTGVGERAFCAGSDIRSNYHEEFQKGERTYGSHRAEQQREKVPRLSLIHGSLNKPIIVAINGHANGGGFEQALAADIRVAVGSAQFGLGEVRLGWLPGGGGTQRLPRLIPKGRALELLITGNRIGAEEAHRLGIVDHVVNTLDDLLPKCE